MGCYNAKDRTIDIEHGAEAVTSERFETGAELRNRTKSYASRIIRLYMHIQKHSHFDDAVMVIAKQLIRSGTSVAANHREAKHARSKAERIAKFNIVLQELEESALWIELLELHDLVRTEALYQLLDETNQLISIFVTSLKTLHD
jgi:four helix bundle protein